MIITIIIFGLILGILIFVHELGHFLTARRNGVVAHEFGFGFPPRICGVVKQKNGKRKIVFGNKEYYGSRTLYSINLIPLGGFVRIKGENPIHKEDIKDFDKLSDEDKKYVRMSEDKDSFSKQSLWVRFKILVAGVTMNFILAWVLISVVLMIGAPEPLDSSIDQGRVVKKIGVQIVAVENESPAQKMQLNVGDRVKRVCAKTTCIDIKNANQLREFILNHKGKEISVTVHRGKEVVVANGVPRDNVTKKQGALGISMMETVLVRYHWYEALWESFMRVINLIVLILVSFWTLLMSIFMGHGVSADITGPIGIALMTDQMKDLGFVYLLQFAAILSINLGIINILPIPALDGGRILFLIIEKIKGSPVNHKIEGMMHTVFFTALILLMVYVTVKDVLKLF